MLADWFLNGETAPHGTREGVWPMVKRLFWVGLLVATQSHVSAQVESVNVTFSYVAHLAEVRAQKPFHAPGELPRFLSEGNLPPQQYRRIEFRHNQALWSSYDSPFRLEFFHPGSLYPDPVQMHEFTPGFVQTIRFVQDFFDYHSARLPEQVPVGSGYAGFRLMNRLNNPGRWDELGAFLGKNGFRLLGRNQRYGAWARGLALDGNGPEEIPLFTDWWFGKPKSGDTDVRLYALLDSPSCAGAYEFLIHPGETTTVDVDVVLFFRAPNATGRTDSPQQPVANPNPALAPLTSSFLWGKNSERRFDDYRPEVHDSDGLLIESQTGGLLWRPLDNPVASRRQTLPAANIRGFGLLQRERDFAAYQDPFSFRESEPSVWVRSRGDWGDGNLQLVEQPARSDTQQNVMVFWSPTTPPKPMTPYRFAYTLFWTRETDMNFSPNYVVATRSGGVPSNPSARQFLVDFAGPRMTVVPDNHPPEAIVQCTTNAVVSDIKVIPLRDTHVWRTMFTVQRRSERSDPIELRCFVKMGAEPISETWDYLWNP